VIAGHPLDTIKVRNIHPILVHCIHTWCIEYYTRDTLHNYQRMFEVLNQLYYFFCHILYVLKSLKCFNLEAQGLYI
jgi:hypothetical protein